MYLSFKFDIMGGCPEERMKDDGSCDQPSYDEVMAGFRDGFIKIDPAQKAERDRSREAQAQSGQDPE